MAFSDKAYKLAQLFYNAMIANQAKLIAKYQALAEFDEPD